MKYLKYSDDIGKEIGIFIITYPCTRRVRANFLVRFPPTLSFNSRSASSRPINGWNQLYAETKREHLNTWRVEAPLLLLLLFFFFFFFFFFCSLFWLSLVWINKQRRGKWKYSSYSVDSSMVVRSFSQNRSANTFQLVLSFSSSNILDHFTISNYQLDFFLFLRALWIKN